MTYPVKLSSAVEPKDRSELDRVNDGRRRGEDGPRLSLELTDRIGELDSRLGEVASPLK
jgi:hypothetical protein